MAFAASKGMVCLWGLLLLVFLDSSVAQITPYQKFQDPAAADGSVTFLTVGDWGRLGQYNQSAVAASMGVVGQSLGIEFVVSTGDNFYENGINSMSDPNFKGSFTNIYTAASLQKKWYNVLGNRDYRGKVAAQVDPALRQIDSRWYCAQQYKVSRAGLVDFFFIDTNPAIPEYFAGATHQGNLPNGIVYDWPALNIGGVTDPLVARDIYLSKMLSTLDAELAKSTATWKIVVGHHPVYSAGTLGNTPYLVDKLIPILQKYKVQAYLNGHDHDLQHFLVGGINYITSGAGSQTNRGRGTGPAAGLLFFNDQQGFLSTKLTKTTGSFAFHDIDGKVQYSWTVTP